MAFFTGRAGDAGLSRQRYQQYQADMDAQNARLNQQDEALRGVRSYVPPDVSNTPMPNMQTIAPAPAPRYTTSQEASERAGVQTATAPAPKPGLQPGENPALIERALNFAGRGVDSIYDAGVGAIGAVGKAGDQFFMRGGEAQDKRLAAIDASTKQIQDAESGNIGTALYNFLGGSPLGAVTRGQSQVNVGPTTGPNAGTSTPPRLATPNLLHAVMMTESGGDPLEISPKGAMGRFQVMPATAKKPGFGVAPAKDMSSAELDRVGKQYLEAMLQRYSGNINRALVAYNWGPGNADKWDGRMTNLPKETQEYIRKIRARIGPDMPPASAPLPMGDDDGSEDSVVAAAAAPAAAAAAAPAPAAAAAAPAAATVAGVTAPDDKITIQNSTRQVTKKGGMVETPASPSEELRTKPIDKVREPAANMPRTLRLQEMRNLQEEQNAIRSMLRTAANPKDYVQKQAMYNAQNTLIENLASQQALDQFEVSNDPRMLSAVLSQLYGENIQIGPNSDGTYYMSINGQIGKDSFSKKKIISENRRRSSKAYHDAMKAASLARATANDTAARAAHYEMRKELARIKGDIVKELAKKSGISVGKEYDYYTSPQGNTSRLEEGLAIDGETPIMKATPVPGSMSSIIGPRVFK